MAQTLTFSFRRGGSSSSRGSGQGEVAALTASDAGPPAFVLTADILRELGTESDLPTRVQRIQRLTPLVKSSHLDEGAVELLWIKTKDLSESEDGEAKRVTVELLAALAEGQADRLDVMRAYFFKVVETRSQDGGGENLVLALTLLEALTDRGKNILHIEERVGPFFFNFFPRVLAERADARRALPERLLQVVLNAVMFNPAYLDPEVVVGLIGYIGVLVVAKDERAKMETCLKCLYAIMGYSYVPKEALSTFICILCRAVNLEEHCEEAWRIMASLMATHLGHSALFDLCQVIRLQRIVKECAVGHIDVGLVRGAIFFVGMSVWGAKCVKNMQAYSPMTLLPTFAQGLRCKHHLVTYEVALQLERLVCKRAGDLRAPGCDAALDLAKALLIAVQADNVRPEHRDEILGHVHATISRLEELCANQLYRGSQQKLYDLTESCSRHRPEWSVSALIDYRAMSIYPAKPGWLRDLVHLMNRHFVEDERDGVRVKALRVLLEKFRANRHIYEDDLVDKVVWPFLKQVDAEKIVRLKLEGIKAIQTICCECNSKEALALLDVLERVLKCGEGDEAPDVHAAVGALIEIFRTRLYQQPATALVRIYNILVAFLNDSYNRGDSAPGGDVRMTIFLWLLGLRSSEDFHLGMALEGEQQRLRFSPHIVCRERRAEDDAGQQATYLSLTKACLCVIRSLTEERDWLVLRLILSKVPTVLQNKAIITKYGKDLHLFVNPLIKLTTRGESKYPECLVNTPSGFGRTDFHNHVFPVLAAMASYNEHLVRIRNNLHGSHSSRFRK